ncbi:MAG: SDR family oxidoreductase [Deltaproteobacteria bacterium]
MSTPRGAAVVTGAGRGIGRSIALKLAEAGYPVAVQSRTASDLEDVVSAIESTGGQAIAVVGDVTQAEAAEALIAGAEAAFGRVEVAVPCAGQAFSAPLAKTDADGFRRLFEVNTMSVFFLVQRAAQAMRAEGGRIVVVASTAAVAGMAYTSAYSATKHAVLGLVRSAALELARHRITVNALCPGWVDTEMFEKTLANIAEKTGCTIAEARATLEGRIPIGSALTPDEVAAMAVHLASEASARLTGQAIVLDGGETIA